MGGSRAQYTRFKFRLDKGQRPTVEIVGLVEAQPFRLKSLSASEALTWAEFDRVREVMGDLTALQVSEIQIVEVEENAR